MERVIVNQLQTFLTDHNLISPSQYGFQKKSSTIIQLIDSHSDWLATQNGGKPTDTIFLDYAKAFDSVSHSKLLLKLHAYGVHNDLWRWFKNFLSNRTQAVMIDGTLSDTLPVISGTPQGAVCSPLLFLIYINDLPDHIPTPIKCLLFADDAKLSREIISMADCVQLQNTLHIVALWSILWQLTLNICKSIVQHFGRGNPQYGYHLNNIALESSNFVKDLGITISKDFTYHQHIKEIISAAAKKLFIFRTCFHSRNILIIKKLFITYIRPSLEYGSVLWNPWSNHEIEQLENIQHKFMSLTYKHHVNYDQQLIDFDLPSLKRRRDEIDLKLYHSILHSKTRIQPTSLFNLNTRIPRRTNSLAITTPICGTSSYLHSFRVRAIHRWNQLPDNVVLIENSSTFAKIIASLQII